MDEVQQEQLESNAVEVKDLQEAGSTTEFLLLSMQKSFNFKPQQVQELLTNSNRYLMQACDRGFQGDFTKVIAWYEQLSDAKNFNKMIALFVEAFEKG